MQNLKSKIKKFDQRWSITSDETAEESFRKFKVRVLNALKKIDDYLTNESISEFCQFYGIEDKREIDPYGRLVRNKNIINKLQAESDPIQFYKLLEVIFSLRTKGNNNKLALLKWVTKAINYSNIELSVTVKNNEEVIFYKTGDEKLDAELVEQPLSFLDNKSNLHLVEALKFYQNKDYIKSAESLRRTLEEFLREKLQNKKGLKKNIVELGKRLKNNSVDSRIRNILMQIFSYLDTYFDNNSKHNDGKIKEAENEFLIYQVGLLLRYITKIV